MTSMYSQPRLQKSKSWKLASIGVAALLGVSVLAYAGYSASDFGASGSSAATTSGAHAPSITIGTISGAPLIPVETAIRLSGVSGLSSAGVTLTYDPDVVSLVDARAGDVSQNQFTWRHDPATGAVVMLLTTALVGGTTGDANFATLTFKAKEGAVGQVSPLVLSVRGAVDAKGTAADIEAVDGSFRNGVPGDVLGDGTVDQSDYDRLASYLVGEDVTIIALNADLDGDGRVTDADAVLLHRKLVSGA